MDKERVLQTISTALDTGVVTKDDVVAVLHGSGPGSAKKSSQAPEANRVSAVDIMFYIAGIVLFAAIAALVGQAWDSGSASRILLSSGTGALFWTIALYFMRQPQIDDIRRGITNSLLLAGSLSLISGGFIIVSEYVDPDDGNFYAAALTLALLGTLHVGFGWQIKRDLLLLIGTLLAVASFPTLIFGILEGSDLPMFAHCLVIAVGGGLLAYATRVIARLGVASGAAFGHTFDALSAFIVLMSLYVASYDDSTGLLWLLVLILGVVGLFYLSIAKQNKLLLGNGSLFLVISIITISYRYFSDNVAISLLISAAGLLGTAIMAATINRRYIKT